MLFWKKKRNIIKIDLVGCHSNLAKSIISTSGYQVDHVNF